MYSMYVSILNRLYILSNYTLGGFQSLASPRCSGKSRQTPHIQVFIFILASVSVVVLVCFSDIVYEFSLSFRGSFSLVID